MALPRNAVELLIEQRITGDSGSATKDTLSLVEAERESQLRPADRFLGLLSLRALAVSLTAEINRLEAEHVRKFNLHLALQQYEEALIRCALEKAGGCQRSAARMLDVKPTTLNSKIKRYRINWKVVNDDQSKVEKNTLED